MKEINFTNLEHFIFAISAFLLAIILCYNFQYYSIFALPIFLFFKNKKVYFIFFLLGFACCILRLENLKINVIKQNEPATIEATVLKTFFKNGGERAIISNILCESCDEKYTKLIASFKQEDKVKMGERVKLEGYFVPLPSTVYPYFYDVEAKNKFQKIAGFFSVRSVSVESEPKFNFFQIAKSYTLKVVGKMEKESHKSVAIALLLGDKGKISKQDYESFKASGLAHILAISGLHMSICVILIFGFFFRIFAFTSIALKYNTKQFSALLGLGFGLFYLMLAGVPISGLRSFLMVSFLFSGYIFYTGASGLRSLSLAAFCILIMWPEEAMFPSFQLSFISVLCLLKCYNFEIQKEGWWVKVVNPILITAISSAAVSILTLPFAIHHFGFVHFYGAISNIVAIPILATFVMPFAILSLITNSVIVISVFEFGINILFIIANFVSKLPFSAIYMNYFNGYLLSIFTFGLIFTLCFKNIFKLFGASLILISIICYGIFAKKPFIVFNDAYVVIKDGENYVSLFFIPEGFLKEVWQEKLNTKFTPFANAELSDFSCNEGVCYGHGKNKFTFIYQETEGLEVCTNGLLINMASERKDFNCNFAKIVTVKEIEKNGATPFVF